MQFQEHVTPYRLVRCEDLESLRSMMVNGAFACAFEGDHSILVPIPDAGSHAGDDWACFRIDADLPLGTVGVAAEVTGLLAAADISVLVMSGYRTDYFLVRDSQRQSARDALIGGGHHVEVHRERGGEIGERCTTNSAKVSNGFSSGSRPGVRVEPRSGGST